MFAPLVAKTQAKPTTGEPARGAPQLRGSVPLVGNQAMLARLAKHAVTTQAGLRLAPHAVEADLDRPGLPLEPSVRTFFEDRMSADLSAVRIHTGAAAEASAAAVEARAYTVGPDIVFGPAGYAPSTDDGAQLLAHELSHVLQDQGGVRVLRRQSLSLRNGNQVGDAPSKMGNNKKEDAEPALTRLLHLWAISTETYNDTLNRRWAALGPGDVIPDADLAPLKDAITKAEKPDLANDVANSLLGLNLPKGRGVGDGQVNDPGDLETLQNRLIALGFLAAMKASKVLDNDTKSAVIAFKTQVAEGTLGLQPARPNEIDAGLDKFGGQTITVLGDQITATPGRTKDNPSPTAMTVNKPLSVFQPKQAPPDKNKVSVFFTPASDPTEFVNQQGLRSQYDTSEWILIAVPGLFEEVTPNWITISTAEIEKCLGALMRPSTKIDSLRLAAHSRGHRGLEHTIGKGGMATVNVSLVEKITVFDASYQDLGNAITAQTGMPAAANAAKGGVQLYDVTVANVSGLKGIQIDASRARALFYVRFVQDGLALGKIDPVDIKALRSDPNKNVRDATNRLLAKLPPRGTFSTRNPLPAGMTDIKDFLEKNKGDLALVDDKTDGLSPLVAPADAGDPGLDLGFKFDLNKKDPNRSLSAHHWLAAELAHEAVE